MSDAPLQIGTLAAKEVRDAWRTRLLLIVAASMLVAGFVSLVVAAFALRDAVATYHASRDLLLSMGRSADTLAMPVFYPLKLFRGFIEHIEITGAILGIVLGHRAAAAERGRNTLSLLLTRPLAKTTFLAGKILGNVAVIISVLAIVFGGGLLGIITIGGLAIGTDALARIGLTFVAAVFYTGLFFVLGFILALTISRPAHAILLAFSLWLLFVLIAPQIGDTLDPDNQVAGGVFRTLGIEKPLAREILQSFATYETIRDGIEQSSPAKHFERLSFAVLGIKDSYNGQPIASILKDRLADVLWLAGLLTVALTVLFLRPLDVSKLTKEKL